MIETNLYHDAIMLGRHQNFSRAARALNISQPTLSRRIQTLERALDEPLFTRGRGPVVPTQAGHIFLKHARLVIASSKTMREEISQLKGLMKGSLYIGAGTYPAIALLGPALGIFNQRHPDIDMQVEVIAWNIIPERLARNDFDYCVAESSDLARQDDFEIVRLNRHQGFFYCRQGHPLLEKQNLDFCDLLRYTFVHTVLPSRLTTLFDKLLYPDAEPAGRKEKIRNITVNDIGTMNSTVYSSDTIGIGTYGILTSELKAGTFVALPLLIPALTSSYDIIRKKGTSLSPAGRAFIKILLDSDKQQSIQEADLVKSLGKR